MSINIQNTADVVASEKAALACHELEKKPWDAPVLTLLTMVQIKSSVMFGGDSDTIS